MRVGILPFRLSVLFFLLAAVVFVTVALSAGESFAKQPENALRDEFCKRGAWETIFSEPTNLENQGECVSVANRGT